MKIIIKKRNDPKEKPASSNLPFGKHFTDHMFVMDYTEGKGWHDPMITPYAPLELEPSSMVLHYSQSVFEGMKAYSTSDNRVLLFRPSMNFKRLNVSNERLCIPEIDEEFALKALIELLKVDMDWIPKEPGTSLYIRPFVFATEPVLGVHASRTYKFIIILSPVGAYYKEGINPVKIWIEEEYVRTVKGSLGYTKAAANYASSLKGQVNANNNGYTQVLWLDGIERKYIEEVGTMNVFFKIDGQVITPKLEGSILAGITRDSVIQLLKSWNVPVVERRISVQELYEAHDKGILEEAFGTGTAAAISPIGEFDWAGNNILVADGKTGKIANRLYSELLGIQYGSLEDPFQWTLEVQ